MSEHGSPASTISPPSLVPILSRGQHLSPDAGGCFMEIASFLAGEPWSDRPRCTHRALAALARDVNDLTSDAARPALAPLIPLVIATNVADPRIGPLLVSRSCRIALEYGAGRRSRALRRAAARAEAALLAAPPRRRHGLVDRAVHTSVTRAVRRAVTAIARTGGPAADRRLRAVLVDAVTAVRELAGVPATAGSEAARWAQACELLDRSASV